MYGDDNVDAQAILKKLINRQPSVMDQKFFKQYAVLLPLVEIEKEIHILFEVRSLKMRSQPGDVCFPGGRIDKEDANALACAIRETTEELGITPATIRHVFPLDYIVAPDGRVIYPYAGEIMSLEKMVLNKAEVAEVFTVPLTFFLEKEPDIYYVNLEVVPEANFPYHLIQDGEDYDWRTRKVEELFYKYNDRVIWGLTAKIIKHFIEIIRAKKCIPNEG